MPWVSFEPPWFLIFADFSTPKSWSCNVVDRDLSSWQGSRCEQKQYCPQVTHNWVGIWIPMAEPCRICLLSRDAHWISGRLAVGIASTVFPPGGYDGSIWQSTLFTWLLSLFEVDDWQMLLWSEATLPTVSSSTGAAKFDGFPSPQSLVVLQSSWFVHNLRTLPLVNRQFGDGLAVDMFDGRYLQVSKHWWPWCGHCVVPCINDVMGPHWFELLWLRIAVGSRSDAFWQRNRLARLNYREILVATMLFVFFLPSPL